MDNFALESMDWLENEQEAIAFTRYHHMKGVPAILFLDMILRFGKGIQWATLKISHPCILRRGDIHAQTLGM